MKLAGKKKLRRVRKTMYEDPGNPFAESEHEGDIVNLDMPYCPMPTTSSAVVATTSEYFLLKGRPSADAIEAPLTSHPPVASSYEDHAPSPIRHDTTSPKSPTSANAKPAASRLLEENKDVSVARRPRQGPWQREDVRNTKFYAFYDDIFEDSERP